MMFCVPCEAAAVGVDRGVGQGGEAGFLSYSLGGVVEGIGGDEQGGEKEFVAAKVTEGVEGFRGQTFVPVGKPYPIAYLSFARQWRKIFFASRHESDGSDRFVA